jgi:hypothetical protein
MTYDAKLHAIFYIWVATSIATAVSTLCLMAVMAQLRRVSLTLKETYEDNASWRNWKAQQRTSI